MAGTSPPNGPLLIGDLQIDLTRRVLTKASVPIDISSTEWQLLDILVRKRGVPVASKEILSAVWGPELKADDAYLATWVYRLRQKLEVDPNHPSIVRTIPGVGYQFDG